MTDFSGIIGELFEKREREVLNALVPCDAEDQNSRPLIASQQTIFHRVKVNYKAAAELGDQTHEGISSFFWSRVTIVSHLVGLFGQLLLPLRYYVLPQCLVVITVWGEKECRELSLNLLYWR